MRYLNTDLDLKSPDDLEAIAAALESRRVSPLHVTRGEDGLWCATFESDHSFDEPSSNIAAILDAVESLVREHKATWAQCALKEFNIGYDCGDELLVLDQGLSNDVLRRMAAAGASLRWTLYPGHPEITGQSHEDRMGQR